MVGLVVPVVGGVPFDPFDGEWVLLVYFDERFPEVPVGYGFFATGFPVVFDPVFPPMVFEAVGDVG